MAKTLFVGVFHEEIGLRSYKTLHQLKVLVHILGTHHCELHLAQDARQLHQKPELIMIMIVIFSRGLTLFSCLARWIPP